MKYNSWKFSSRSRRAVTLFWVAAFGATVTVWIAPAHSAPKSQLQIWPGRRVLLVLPVAPSATWNADADLGRAIVPVAQPELVQALEATGKFSITSPYRFDPILRRGVTEKQLAEDDINALLTTPTLETSRPIVDKLKFDQPVMTAAILLEELRIGGTSKSPTVQIQVSGKLYEQGNPNPVKSVVVTSRPVTGKTPSVRLATASRLAFDEVAAQFIEPPPAFELPLPPPTKPTSKATSMPAPTPASGGTTPPTAVPATGNDTAAPAMPATPAMPVTPPNSLSPAPGTPFIPQLPAAQPPLGIAAGEDATVGR